MATRDKKRAQEQATAGESSPLLASLPAPFRAVLAPHVSPSSESSGVVSRATGPLNLAPRRTLNVAKLAAQAKTKPKLDLRARAAEKKSLKLPATKSTVAGLLGKRRAAMETSGDRKPSLLSRRGIAAKPLASRPTKVKATKAKTKASKEAPTFPTPTAAKPERSGGSDEQ